MTAELRDWINQEILPYLPTDRVYQGDKIMFRCPICGDSRKSTTKKRGYYYRKTASYHCFNCDVNLSGMKLLQAFSGEEYDDIKSRFFKSMFDGRHYSSLSASSSMYVEPSRDNVLELKSILKSEWKSPLSEKAHSYLEARKVLSAPFLKEPFYSYYTRKGDEYILIPWVINGVDAYFQLNDFQRLRKSGMKYVFPKSTDKLIYGLDNIDLGFPYLICFEGVYDSLFVPNGLAIGGKNLTDLQERILRKRFPDHRIVFALDNDRPGLVATARTLGRTSSGRRNYFRWFDADTREKDVNDFVVSRGDVNIFADKNRVESMIVDSINMKMWLAKNGYEVQDGKSKQARCEGKVQQRADGNVHAHAPREVQGTV